MWRGRVQSGIHVLEVKDRRARVGELGVCAGVGGGVPRGGAGSCPQPFPCLQTTRPRGAEHPSAQALVPDDTCMESLVEEGLSTGPAGAGWAVTEERQRVTRTLCGRGNRSGVSCRTDCVQVCALGRQDTHAPSPRSRSHGARGPEEPGRTVGDVRVSSVFSFLQYFIYLFDGERGSRGRRRGRLPAGQGTRCGAPPGDLSRRQLRRPQSPRGPSSPSSS